MLARIVAALLLVLLAACGRDDGGGGAAQTPTTSAERPTTTLAAAGPADGMADGVEEIRPGLWVPVEDTITVVATMFLDGSGRPSDRGVLLHRAADLLPTLLEEVSGEIDGSERAPFAVRLLDGEGRILTEVPALSSTSSGTTRLRIPYGERVERELDRLQIVRDDAVVHEVVATPSAPQVVIHEPADGGRLDPRGFVVTYDVSHPDGAESTIFLDVIDHTNVAASLTYDAPPDRFEFRSGAGLPRLPIEDGPGRLHVGAFDGARATLVFHEIEIG